MSKHGLFIGLLFFSRLLVCVFPGAFEDGWVCVAGDRRVCEAGVRGFVRQEKGGFVRQE